MNLYKNSKLNSNLVIYLQESHNIILKISYSCLYYLILSNITSLTSYSTIYQYFIYENPFVWKIK
jgi:hypothetical protein